MKGNIINGWAELILNSIEKLSMQAKFLMFDVVPRSARQVLLLLENMRENLYELSCELVAIAAPRNAFLIQDIV